MVPVRLAACPLYKYTEVHILQYGSTLDIQTVLHQLKLTLFDPERDIQETLSGLTEHQGKPTIGLTCHRTP